MPLPSMFIERTTRRGDASYRPVELAEGLGQPMFENPKPAVGMKEPAATDSAALLAIATNTPFDVGRYRRAYMDRGLSTEWRGLEDMWNMSHAGASRARIEKMISKKAKEVGINFDPVTDKDVLKAITDFSEVQGEGMMHEVASRLASEATHPNADNNEKLLRQTVNETLETHLVAERNASKNMKAAVDQAHIAMDPSYPTLIGGMIAQVFLPTDVIAAKSLRDKLIPDDGSGVTGLSTAKSLQEIRDYVAKAPPDEKNRIVARMNDWVKNNTEILTDWQVAGMLGQIDNGKLLETGDPEDKVAVVLSAVSDIADYLYAFRGLKVLAMFGQGIKTLPRTLRLTNAVNRRRSASIMQGLLSGARTNDTLKNWGISAEEVVATQLPKPSVGSVVNMPGGVAEDAARVSAIREEVSALDAATRAPLFNEDEVLSAAERVAKEVEQAWKPQLRVNLSTVGFTSDRAGVEFGLTLGRDNLHGFVRAKDAATYAKALDDTGESVSVLKVDPATQALIPYFDGKFAVNRLDTISSADKGEFYVKLKHRYDLQPMDKMLFNDDAVLAPTWMGRGTKFFLNPASIFKPEVANKYVANFLTETALQDVLGSIVRPLFKELDGAQRARVGEIFSWTEDFGRNTNRSPTWDELRTQFPDASDKELFGWWRVKQFYDTAYALNNQRLFREWNARGYMTMHGDSMNLRVHGRPLSVPELRSRVDKGFVTVYNPDTNKGLALRNKDLEAIYEKRGWRVMEVDSAISTGNRNYHKLILVKSSAEGWHLKNLDSNVLKYIPGYYPRIYEDFYYIKRVTKGARIDGRIEDYEDTVAVASTEKEAQDFVNRIQAAAGDDSISFKVASDVRLRTRDATAADLDRMRIEGRLFFDERNAHKLYNVNGNPAEIVDPINAINRTARMLSRQMATEDLIRSMKQAWKNTYGDHIKGLNVETDTSVVVGDKLSELVKTSPKADRAMLTKARELWDHIRLIEGSSGEGATWFRGMSIKTAEFLHNLRGIGGNVATKGLLRNAHKAAPVEWMKNLAFFDFLVTRPVRQLILQGAQHLFIAPMSPSYMGKWQLDTASVLQGLKREGLVKAGLKNVSEAQSNRNAALMGLSREEYDLLIRQVRLSGITQSVNVHSYAGDLPRRIQSTRYSAAGRVAEGAVGALTARPVRRALEKYGFELGEQFNVTASYLMALRLYRQANKIKKLTDISSSGWDEIRTQGSNYALAMHRANSSAYQYGLLSLPLQFLQFTHKVFLTYLRAFPGVDKLGNKAFTGPQARKILMGQLIMFGGAAFGIRPEVEQWLEGEGVRNLPEPVKDIIAGGSVDWLLDKWAQKMTGDEELNWAFGDWLAPGGNMIHLVREMVQTIAEQPIIVTLLGPSFVTSSRFAEGVMMAKTIWSNDQFEESTPEERALFAVEAVAAGLMSGYNDFMKARLAMKMGFWASQSGHQTEVEAKFAQAVLKVGLGLTPEQLLDSNAMRMDVQDELKNLDEVAQESYNRMYRITALFGDNSDREKFLNDIRQEQALLQVLEPHEIQYVWRKWQEIERDSPSRKPLADIIGEAIGKGYQGEELLDKVRTTRALDHDEATRAQLIELLTRAQQDIDWTNEEIRESAEQEIENVKRLTAEEAN